MGAGSFLPPVVHPADWTPERIQAFWDNFSRTPILSRNYFSKNHGEGILEAIERHAPLRGTVLDYGCGRGDFLELLVDRGYRAMGCDSSSESVASTASRLAGKPGFLGAFASEGTPPQPAGTITLLEVVEHLPPEALPPFLRRAAGFLEAGGRIVTTSPHREDLDGQKALCPECACLFHVSQHLARIDRESLARAAAAAGLVLELGQPTLLRRNRDRSLRTGLQRRLVERLLPEQAPHLLCVLRKQ